MFGIKPKTLHHWYKGDLSGYKQDVGAGRWGGKKIMEVDMETGEVLKETPVPIAKPENFGSHMTIDEKQIGKKMYTIMTNANTGKIALLAQTMKPAELKQAVENYLPEKTDAVKSISCDMSPSYKKLCKEVFPNTQLVIDKFHVIKHLMDALQQVRKELKTECLTHDKTLAGQSSPTGPEQEKPWTEIELMERSRYTLFKMQDDWEENEKDAMAHLFNNYPRLKTAYELAQQLRLWYSGSNVGKHFIVLEKELYNWYDEVDRAKISAFKGVRKMIEKHQADIMNYFKEGQTNARAENMNGRIQRFLANNFGIRDRDFFLFRMAGYFS